MFLCSLVLVGIVTNCAMPSGRSTSGFPSETPSPGTRNGKRRINNGVASLFSGFAAMRIRGLGDISVALPTSLARVSSSTWLRDNTRWLYQGHSREEIAGGILKNVRSTTMNSYPDAALRHIFSPLEELRVQGRVGGVHYVRSQSFSATISS